MKFSERYGITKKEIQVDSVEKSLRVKLWNIFIEKIDEKFRKLVPNKDEGWKFVYYVTPVFQEILQYEMIEPIDDYSLVPNDKYAILRNLKFYFDQYNAMRNKIKDYFLSCNWYKVYEFLEFLNKSKYSTFREKDFIQKINKVLEDEKSAFRIVGNKISLITDEIEINEIENALVNPIASVKDHINQALTLYSDKQSPDYRNSIKEAISAVEAIVKLISGDKKTTLGIAIEKLESKNIIFHEDLKIAFKKLYSYTSDADGIRHALMGESNLSSEDAKFMLIACSAFVNYLAEKALKAKIDLQNL